MGIALKPVKIVLFSCIAVFLSILAFFSLQAGDQSDGKNAGICNTGSLSTDRPFLRDPEDLGCKYLKTGC